MVNKSTQLGVGMIEVLVSVFVLAIGLLGLATLQANAIRFNDSAYLRSIAVNQANDMLDRMRANSTGITGGNYNSVTGIPSLPSCSPCTSAQIAQRDVYEWNTDNQTFLPSGQGTVVRNGDIFTVTIRWDNERSGASGLACSGDASADLTCFIVSAEL